MIQSIGRTIQSAMSWPTMNLAELSRSLASPYVNDDYNQFRACYQCHGNPLGRVYVNSPWPAVCFDVDNEVLYLKQDLKISNKAWQSQSVNDPVFDNLTHYWSMDEASGTRADSKGSIDLNESGGVVASGTGKDGNAADFISTSSLKSTLSWRPVPPFSVALWAKARALPASLTVLFNVNMVDAEGVDLDIIFPLNSSGNMDIRPTVDSDALVVAFGALNTWHLIVLTTDGFTTYASVDGAVFTTAIETANFIQFQTAITNTVEIAHPGNSTSFDGLVDEVMTWDVLLTQANVTTLWNGGVGKFYRP